MAQNQFLRSTSGLVRETTKWAITIWFAFTFTLFLLSFTTLPFWWTYDLATEGSSYDFEPDYIVLMGGSGMPGRSTLIRAYYTAEMSKLYNQARVIIALPEDTTLTNNQLNLIKKELSLRGVDSTKIVYEPCGTNTRSQAINIKSFFDPESLPKLLVVSDPEHIYRSVKSFQKVGFKQVGSLACFENDIKISLNYDSKKIGGQTYNPEIGNSQQLRYQFWNHLKYEITLLREYFAITYYKLQNWI